MRLCHSFQHSKCAFVFLCACLSMSLSLCVCVCVSISLCASASRLVSLHFCSYRLGYRFPFKSLAEALVVRVFVPIPFVSFMIAFQNFLRCCEILIPTSLSLSLSFPSIPFSLFLLSSCVYLCDCVCVRIKVMTNDRVRGFCVQKLLSPIFKTKRVELSFGDFNVLCLCLIVRLHLFLLPHSR